jgi:DNA-binding SARP family transcriptional activator
LIVAAFCADLEARWPDLIETLEAAEELLVDQAAAPRFVPLLTYLRLKALAMNGDFDQYRRLAQQLQAGDWQHQPGTAAVLPYVTILTWDSALADEAYRRGLQEVERGLVQIDGTRQPQELGLLLLCRALTLALLAHPTEAVEDLQRANDLLTGKTGHHYAALHHSLAAIASYHLGRVADGDRHQARVEKLNQLLEYPFHWVDVSSHRAYCLLRTGQLDQALPSVVQAMRLLVGEQRRHTLCWLPSVATTVLRAAVLHEQKADYARSLLAQRFHCWCGLDGVLLPVLDIVILKEQAITNGQKRLFFHELTVQERKLLLHVSLAPGMAIPQTSAAEELWPEKDPERQRSSLDNLVSRLRSKLKALIPSAAKQYLTIEQGYVTLKHVSVDVNRFFDAAQQALDHVNRGRKWRAELLFAEAFALLDTAFVRPFDFAYLEELQDRFELALANALQAATDLLLRKDDFDTARNYALAAFRYCPGHPHLVRTCYQLLRRYGDHSGAGAILAAYRRTQEKYAEDPSELAELIELVTA